LTKNDEDIIQIDRNTRKRKIGDKWKLEKKDPITGVWVIHPAQFFADNRKEMEDMFRDMDREEQKFRESMFEPKNAEEFLKKDVARYEEDAKKAKVKKVLDVDSSGGMSRENNLELIFDGSIGDKHSRYIAGCWSYSGDFYEPPSEECWFSDFYETLHHQETRVKEEITPKRVFTGRKITNKHGVVINEELPVNEATKEQIEKEKNRLEHIYRKDIRRLEHLRKFKDF
jgi:hypothetical protein